MAPSIDTTELVDEALPRFKAAVGKRWPQPTPRMARIHQVLAAGDLKSGRQLLQEEINENPDNDEANYLIAEVQFNRSRFGLANEGFEKVLRAGPTFPQSDLAFYFYGLCQLRLGNTKCARASLLAMHELRPNHGEALFSLGVLDLQRGEPGIATTWFDAAAIRFRAAQDRGMDKTDSLARAYCGLGDANLQLDDLEKAKQYLEQGLELNPRIAKAQYALSRVLLRLDDEEGAQRALAEFQKLKAAEDALRAQSAARPPAEDEE